MSWDEPRLHPWDFHRQEGGWHSRPRSSQHQAHLAPEAEVPAPHTMRLRSQCSYKGPEIRLPALCSPARATLYYIHLMPNPCLEMWSQKHTFLFKQLQQHPDALWGTQATGDISVISEEKKGSGDRMGRGPDGKHFYPFCVLSCDWLISSKRFA